MSAAAVIIALACLAADEGRITVFPAGNNPTNVVFERALDRVEADQLRDSEGIAPSGSVAATIDAAVGRRWLTVSLKSADSERGAPIIGDYELRGGRLSFRPKFALNHGSTYVARSLDGRSGRLVASREHTVAKAERSPRAEVVAISPDCATVPANVLKFYVTFSAPMREGQEVLELIRLRDRVGGEIVAPWRDIELWNDDATRLTLFIHPGRIKQGVNLREQLGPIFSPGRKYEIIVEQGLRDAAGGFLKREFRHAFETTAELHERIDVAKWKIVPPAAASRTAIVVGFGRPLDRYLAARCLTIVDPAGRPVAGEWKVEPDGAATTFTPADEWRPGRYELRVEPTLEDLCGNTPVRVFDHDLEAPKVEVLPPMLTRSIECR